MDMKLSDLILKCGICERQLQGDDEIHIDHIIPRSYGGPTAPWNLRLSHAICNISRQNHIEPLQIPLEGPRFAKKPTGWTHIPVSVALRDALVELKRGNDTYDDVIRRLIEAERHQRASQDEAKEPSHGV